MTLPEAVLSLLRSDPNLTVYDGVVPDLPELPYVVVFFAENPPQSTSYDGLTNWREDRILTHSVGSTPEQVRLVAQKVEAVLLDVRPAVTGRTTAPIRKAGSQEPMPDTSVNPPVFVGADRWTASNVSAS